MWMDLFAANDRWRPPNPLFGRIVKLLERFNLSTTSDDIKGIALRNSWDKPFGVNWASFLRAPDCGFCGRDARSARKARSCATPAAGSGGFRIRFFEYVRDKIEYDIQRQKEQRRVRLKGKACRRNKNWLPSTPPLRTEPAN
jgi:type I restriction enzyme M protein